MHRSRYVIASLLLVSSAGACQRDVAEISPADKAAVQASIDAYVRAAVAANWDAWGKTLTPDVFYSPPHMAPMIGRDAAVAFAKTFPKVVSLTPVVDEIAGSGDLAYVRGSYTLAVTLPDGKPMTEHGAFLEIHRRQSDGSWPYKDAIYHSTDALPVAAAPTK